MSSSTPDVTSTPHQPGIGSSTNQDQATEETNPANTDPVAEGLDEERVPENKRAKTSTVWSEFKDVTSNGTDFGQCIHCKKQIKKNKSRSTTQFKRHLETCPALTNGKFDMAKMREAAAHWILMHEHPFSIMEEEGFNMMQKRGMPQWEKVSRVTIKKDCMQVYEVEKKKLKAVLKNVNKISLMTDLWKSSNQRIEYMVLTAHFIDSNWRLQKRIISFVHIPPPRRGVEIADCFYKCLQEWGIENKVYTISVDNAISNDVAIRNLKDTFSRTKKLLCGGKLFHVRCCAHILNLMVQDGFSEISNMIDSIHESVRFINHSEARLRSFAAIVQQLQLPERKLILDCKTRWNSTFEMLSTAIKFKDVFPRYQDREPSYNCCPAPGDWVKVEKICEILEVFNAVTKIISGSDYPTSNLFLNEVHRVKVLLDKNMNNENEFIRAMVSRMKSKFDKYWGECNLLMFIAAILDPRCKIMAVEYCLNRMYSEQEARANMAQIRDALFEIYEDYVSEHQHGDEHSAETNVLDHGSSGGNSTDSTSGWSEILTYVKSKGSGPPQESDLDAYLSEGCFIYSGDPAEFNALEWWKANSLRYRILSKVARDILAIPITTVASEAAFSAGSRVIDTYHASLAPETVQALLCGGDWCRNLHGVKKKNKNEKKSIEIALG
ncbi:putative Zinc finger, BED-type [Corchorus capsularis]|uniref:Putative Zinc finger, BED-type n=1 Tax=Corchorus capsularis TaxID=210143 RepID=A0A1R3GA24_COCAP|nr:putative Zinc finger, BED-type [Corchorus capsularis]